MFDFDPRDYDSRDNERHSHTPSRRARGSSGDQERDHDWRQPDTRTRNRDDGDARSLGRGPGNDRQGSDAEGRDRDHDSRWADRDRDDRERGRDVPDAFTRHVHLPRGPERELVHDRDREYTLRGSESRTLATVGAFRVVSSRDLRDRDGSPADCIRREHLESGLALWNYCFDSARFIFGESLGDRVADDLRVAVLEAGALGLQRTEISRDVFGRNRSAREITQALTLLQSLGIARCEVDRSGAGRPV